MSGPPCLLTGLAEKANQVPSGEYAAAWPTTTTLLAIAMMARAVGAGVPGGTGDPVGAVGDDAPALEEGLAVAVGVAVARGMVGVGEIPPETGTT